MWRKLVIEGLGNVSFVNGLLRIQTLAVGPDGKISESGTIEIPVTKLVINNFLTAAAQGISEKIGGSLKLLRKMREEIIK